MIGVCTRYEEHLSIGSRITRDVIAEQQRTDLIYQRCVPRSKHFPPAYYHYTRIIGNEQQEHDSSCNLSKPCKSKENPKPSRDLLSIKVSSTRIMIDQCDTLAQGLIGLIGYSYQQVATSFPEDGLRSPKNSEVKLPWPGEIWGWVIDREVLPECARVRTKCAEKTGVGL